MTTRTTLTNSNLQQNDLTTFTINNFIINNQSINITDKTNILRTIFDNNSDSLNIINNCIYVNEIKLIKCFTQQKVDEINNRENQHKQSFGNIIDNLNIYIRNINEYS